MDTGASQGGGSAASTSELSPATELHGTLHGTHRPVSPAAHQRAGRRVLCSPHLQFRRQWQSAGANHHRAA